MNNTEPARGYKYIRNKPAIQHFGKYNKEVQKSCNGRRIGGPKG
jgi:hypothetical protein